mmetsp:Transcript_1482/g.3138  ORF Transcript_1482/g.3138 Transcript_1482/m.3138 type:complete len:415 (-) Transcript_1482:677-1921(-)
MALPGPHVALDGAPALEFVRGDLHQGAHLPSLAHLDLLVQGHVLLPQRRQHAVGALEVLQVGVRLCLRRVHHLEHMADLLHQHRHRVPRLLRTEKELVDLQAVDERGLGLDQDGLRPARLVKHVLALDVVEFRLQGDHLGRHLVEAVLHVGALLGQLRVRGGGLPHLVLAAPQLVSQRAFVLLVAVDPRGQVVVLRLQRVGLVLQLLQPLLHLLLRLQRQDVGLLEHPVLLLEQGLHLRRIPGLRLRGQLRVHLVLEVFLQLLTLPVQGRDLLGLLDPGHFLFLQVHLVLPELVHQRVHLVPELPEVVRAGPVLLLHSGVLVLGLPQGAPQGLHGPLEHFFPPLDLGLALHPLVAVVAVHVQLLLDAFFLHGQLVQRFSKPQDAFVHPVLVHLIVLDLLQLLDVLVLGLRELFL